MITRSNSRKRAAELFSGVLRAQPERDRDSEGAGDSEECLVKRRRVECVTRDQMPITIVAMIADRLSRKDQADFRLTCKSWCEAYPVQQRIVLRQTADWEDSAREIRQLCQEAVIVVEAAGIKDLPQLFLSPDCDQVSLDTRPGWASIWSLEPMHYVPDKIKEVLVPLRKVMEAMKDNPGRDKLELQLRVRSTQAISDALRAAIKDLSSTIFQLRVLESLSFFSKQTFPIMGIKVLAFTLPYRWDMIPQFQAAISCLPHLRELHLYLWTANATKHANLLLRVLRELPKVASLRVGARWYPLTLVTSNLIHITNLELSWKVTLDHKPRQLKYLCLQDIRHDVEPTADYHFEGHQPLFLELAQSDSPVEICVHECNSSTLLELPRNVRCLTLVQCLAKTDYAFMGHPGQQAFLDCQQALHQFSMLKVLQLGDFLTDDLIAMFEGVCMPQLDTFGFWLDMYMEVRKKYCKVVNGENVWSASDNVRSLATAFPALRQFKVCFTGMLKDTHVLNASFMSIAIFPKLRGVTCCTSQLKVVFRHLSPSCYLVTKLRNQ